LLKFFVAQRRCALEVKKPKWFDDWVEIDENYLQEAGTSWKLKANAPKRVRKEYEKLMDQITVKGPYSYSWKHER
jgi:hypothetical protein